MSTVMQIAIAAIVGLCVGMLLYRLISKPKTKHLQEEAERKAESIIQKAHEKAKKIQIQKEGELRNRLRQSKQQQESEHRNRTAQIKEAEDILRQRDRKLTAKKTDLETKLREADDFKSTLEQKQIAVKKKEEETQKERESIQETLAQIAQMDKDEAQKRFIENIKKEAAGKALSIEKDIVDKAKENASKEARKIIIQTIQRTASEQVIENAVSVFHLESDDIKGQIIGREGRNIRAIEAATGVEINIDDTPEAIMLSSFDPLRREIARLSIQRLVADGRIHPARIEEIVAKTKKKLEAQIMEIGERTVIDLGILGMHKELIRMVGKMRFRSSYGQNLLMHSREVANLCSIMSAELNLNAKLAKRAGLLHDIGKVPDTEQDAETPHALLGMEIAKKYGESATVCNAIGAHHDEIPMEYVISPIVQACDAMSGARPGARREALQKYIERLKDLENIALQHNAVENAYAIQAGRELRVIVQNEKVNDQEIDTLSYEIAKTIQDTMTYPGQVKVTVIREKRAVSVAK